MKKYIKLIYFFFKILFLILACQNNLKTPKKYYEAKKKIKKN